MTIERACDDLRVSFLADETADCLSVAAEDVSRQVECQ